MTLADLASLVGLACSACLVLGFALGWWANNATVPEDGWLPLEPWEPQLDGAPAPRRGGAAARGSFSRVVLKVPKETPLERAEIGGNRLSVPEPDGPFPGPGGPLPAPTEET